MTIKNNKEVDLIKLGENELYTEKLGFDDERSFLSKNLNFLLKQKSINSNQLANALGLPFMTISRILSGKTEDPRLSTLKIISDYFKIPIDLLISKELELTNNSAINSKVYRVPKFNWENISQVTTLEKLDLSNWSEWQTFTLKVDAKLSKTAFALESKPSMYPKFPKDTVFIIAPDIYPSDGDLVLIKLKQNNEFTLRELLLDPPEKKLLSLTEESKSIDFDENEHQILGVCCLTILYDHKIKIAK